MLSLPRIVTKLKDNANRLFGGKSDRGAARRACVVLGVSMIGFGRVNRARNGARTLDALLQIADVGGTRCDLVLIHVGGNDVLRRTPLRALGPQVRARQSPSPITVRRSPKRGPRTSRPR